VAADGWGLLGRGWLKIVEGKGQNGHKRHSNGVCEFDNGVIVIPFCGMANGRSPLVRVANRKFLLIINNVLDHEHTRPLFRFYFFTSCAFLSQNKSVI
jgi:hypothetical protein